MLPGMVAGHAAPVAAGGGGGGGGGGSSFALSGTDTITSTSSGGTLSGTVTLSTADYSLLFYLGRGEDSVTTPSSFTLGGHAATHERTIQSGGGSGDEMYISMWSLDFDFGSGNQTATVTLGGDDDNPPRGLGVLNFHDGATPQLGTPVTHTGAGNTTTVNITASKTTSYIVCAVVGGSDNPVTLSGAGFTEIIDTRFEFGSSGFGHIWLGYKVAGSTSSQSVGPSGGSQFNETAVLAVEVKAP